MGISGTVHHEPYGSPINDEILPKQGQTRLASLACVSPCFNKISEQTFLSVRPMRIKPRLCKRQTDKNVCPTIKCTTVMPLLSAQVTLALLLSWSPGLRMVDSASLHPPCEKQIFCVALLIRCYSSMSLNCTRLFLRHGKYQGAGIGGAARHAVMGDAHFLAGFRMVCAGVHVDFKPGEIAA